MRTHRLLILLLLLPALAAAQGVSLVDRLPANTSAYLLWHGKNSVEAARSTNALLRLWNDPDFAPVRERITAQFFTGALRRAQEQSLGRPEVEEILSLVENPGLVGFIGPLDLAALTRRQAAGQPRASSTFFAIYDTTGKADVHRKILDRYQARETEKPVISAYDFSGTTVEEFVYAGRASYRAYVNNYFVSANQKAVIEDLIRRLHAPAGDSLSQDPRFQAAHAFTAEGAVIEFFARLPDLTALPFPRQQAVNAPALLRALHVERLHALAGSLSFVGERTRLRVAALGETSTGGLFDLASESGTTFATLGAAPTGASYNAWRMDLAASYGLLRNALKAGLPPGQAGALDMFEAVAGSRIGMSVPDALALFAGEFAAIHGEPSSNPDSFPALFLATTRRPDEVLRVVRLLLAERIATDEWEDNATFLALAMPYVDPKTGAQRKRFVYVAIAPQMVLVAPRKTLLRQALAQLAAGTPAAGTLAADARFLHGRSQLPSQLTGLGYMDLSRFPWGELSKKLVADLSKRQEQASLDLRPIDPESLASVLSRYLHTLLNGWWKDQNGVFWEISLD